ncbi:ARF GTPase-activating protein GIT2 isoform X2 [Tetranychus urticae]|uniref:ARF GTPase-activating protein GIT2 isoform X2 n=1 Tax=Tetranychus urticae TaxID=32264 RepID=UPI000D659FB4|nr:ARF GTPase-activating protein GIT2 isoform X2 [Tetranychus urticae]
MSLSRSKIRTIFDCADCSNTDAEWASVNRGVIVCDDCCIVHRNMGREVSQIKSIKKSQWSSSELQMVINLYNSGSNSIWEYTLLNSGSNSLTSSLTHSMRSSFRKKPNPKDGLYPAKNDFIKAKYQKLNFIKKPGPKDSDSNSDVSEELHSSVRSSSLKTSLRLLIAGADPNYLHPAKHNTPLHVAAKSGQLAQMELLFAYGADPLITDLNGKTALDYAKSASHNDIVERLIEFQFELTDRLSHFLCGRKPDHKQGQHYLIPQLSDDSIDPPEDTHLAKTKLQALTNKQFEELAKDVYDEVDRRELDEIWLQLRNQSTASPEHNLVPFLPVNPMFSSTRNQGRQKLARFSAKNFTSLLIDVLIESKRRQLHAPKSSDAHPPHKLRITNSRIEWCLQNTSDDDTDPLYDSVASDDERDYDEVEDASALKSNHKLASNQHKSDNNNSSSDQYRILQNQLSKSDSLLKELIVSNKDMKTEISTLKNIVNTLVNENAQLRSLVVTSKNQTSQEIPFTNSPEPTNVSPHLNHHHYSHAHHSPVLAPRSPNKILMTRAASMYDKPSGVTEKSQITHQTPTHTPVPPSPATVSSPLRIPQSCNSPQPVSRSPIHGLQAAHSNQKLDHESFSSQSDSEYAVLSPKHNSSHPPAFPIKDVFRKTEQITKGIQELLQVSLEGRQEVFIKCAENIQQVVFNMIDLFPESLSDGELKNKEEQLFEIIEALRNNTTRLMSECQVRNSKPDGHSEVEKIIDSAYDIARVAKQLIMILNDP